MNFISRKLVILVTALLSFPLLATTAAAESAQCKTPRFSNVGWTDSTAAAATAIAILRGVGYKPKETILSIPITYASMKNGDIDIYLSDWEPSMANDIRPYLDAGDVEVLQPPNLTGAKYTIAVPKFVADAGVRDFADIAQHADKFERKFYGLEPGDSGGDLILSMIDKNAFGLGDFELVESSEQGMLAQANRRIKRSQWVAFLAWEPHPMNVNLDIVYLTGGDDYFGPNLGGAEIFSNVRRGYLTECKNVGQFLQNLQFTLPMYNKIMSSILDDELEPQDAAIAYLKDNPNVVDGYLRGVKTFGGDNARTAFRAEYGF